MFCMKRRDLITLLGGAAATWPLAARAQQPERVRRIGVLMGVAATNPDGQASVAALRQQLRELGWSEGRNVQIEYRWLEADPDLARQLAIDLLRLHLDVIVGHTTRAITALFRETQSIPIVFVNVTDPIGQGFVQNFAKPGGNITGFTNFEFSMGGKWLGLLKDIAPSVSRVAMMFNPDTAPYYRHFVHSVEAARHQFAIDLIVTPVHDATDIERATDALAHGSNGALIVLPDAFTGTNFSLIIAAATKHQLPSVYPYRFFVKNGGLISYGIDSIDQFRQAALYVDRILKGANPNDLPVQGPTKFVLAINLKTAKALGLDVPFHLQQLADEVIE